MFFLPHQAGTSCLLRSLRPRQFLRRLSQGDLSAPQPEIWVRRGGHGSRRRVVRGPLQGCDEGQPHYSSVFGGETCTGLGPDKATGTRRQKPTVDVQVGRGVPDRCL